MLEQMCELQLPAEVGGLLVHGGAEIDGAAFEASWREHTTATAAGTGTGAGAGTGRPPAVDTNTYTYDPSRKPSLELRLKARRLKAGARL